MGRWCYWNPSHRCFPGWSTGAGVDDLADNLDNGGRMTQKEVVLIMPLSFYASEGPVYCIVRRPASQRRQTVSKIDYQALRAGREKRGRWSALEYGESRFDGDDAPIHRYSARIYSHLQNWRSASRKRFRWRFPNGTAGQCWIHR